MVLTKPEVTALKEIQTQPQTELMPLMELQTEQLLTRPIPLTQPQTELFQVFKRLRLQTPPTKLMPLPLIQQPTLPPTEQTLLTLRTALTQPDQ